MVKQVQSLPRECQALRIRERILDGQAHVGHTELGLHAAVLKLHGTVNHALRMHQHLYLTGLHTEEPLRLDHLEPLVHHRGRVDGDLRAHIPRRVFQGVCLRHVGYLLHRLQAEGTATGRQQDLLDAVMVFADETLEDGRVLTVHRQYLGVVGDGEVTDQLSSHHECLLIGQAYGLTRLDGVNRRREPRKTHHGGQHHVDRSGLHDLVEGLRPGIHLHLRHITHQLLQLVIALFIGYHDGSRLELMRLLSQQLHLVVRCQTIDLIQVCVFPDHLQGLRAYGSRGSQNSYLFLHLIVFLSVNY